MDIKKKELNLIYCIIFFVVGVAYALFYLNENIEAVIFALMPGMILLIISIVCSEQIGLGDGIMVITLGLLVNVAQLLSVLVWTFIFVSIVAIIKILFNKKTTIPLAPFLLMGQICVLVSILID